ncbi:MAG: NAD(P)-dependent oxidoreductase [Phycisphaerae bacterium]|nr:NAD(P)-dependent oxidoreductase [Gemmatimonadaceae bacterium]
MRYLVTGARGFIGSAIVRAALDAGHSVAALVRPGSTAIRLGDIARDVTFIHSDFALLSSPETREAFSAFAPDVVVHAAWEGVAGADRNAEWQVARNVPVTRELLMLAADAGATHFIGLGSQAEYGPCSGRITEDQPLSPTTLYGVAKVSACELTQEAARTRAIRHSWLRVFSTYGAGSEPGWVLPMAANTMARGTAPDLTPCEQRWEFLHVSDAARGVVAVGARRAVGVFNLGSGDARPLRDVILSLRDRVDPTLNPNFGAVAYRSDQVMYLEADVSRIKGATGWCPTTSLEAGLDEIAREALEHQHLAHA